jgi:hypothetical protein
MLPIVFRLLLMLSKTLKNFVDSYFLPEKTMPDTKLGTCNSAKYPINKIVVKP